MRSDLNIFLVGPMGAGKSSIGRRLAKQLEFPFWDSDREIERRTGVDIPTIFEYEAEEGFRNREAAVIDELTRKTGIILATGGGAVVRPENRRRLKDRGFVVYLRTSIKQQYRRTARDRNRPMLQTRDDPHAALRSLQRERGPLYEKLADYSVSTDGCSISHIIDQLIENLPDD